jgi:hypothetical protein
VVAAVVDNHITRKGNKTSPCPLQRGIVEEHYPLWRGVRGGSYQ